MASVDEEAAGADRDSRQELSPGWFTGEETDSGLAGAVGELVYQLMRAHSLDAVLSDVAKVAGHNLSVSSSLTTERRAQLTTLAGSDPLAVAVDQVQYELGTGPCLETLHTGRMTIVADLRAEPRWQPFPQRALAFGVRSCLCLPLATPDHGTVATLNLYSRTLGAFDDPADVGRATTLAVLAGLVVGVAERTVRHEQLIDQLRAALSSRSVIDQAVGVLMAQRRCDADQAMSLLRQASQRSNRKVRELAVDIVASVSAESRPPT